VVFVVYFWCNYNNISQSSWSSVAVFQVFSFIFNHTLLNCIWQQQQYALVEYSHFLIFISILDSSVLYLPFPLFCFKMSASCNFSSFAAPSFPYVAMPSGLCNPTMKWFLLLFNKHLNAFSVLWLPNFAGLAPCELAIGQWLAGLIHLFIYLFIFNSRHKAHDTKIINTIQHR